MKKLFNYIDDIFLYTILFWVIGIGCIISSVFNNTYEGATFYGGIISMLITSFVLWRFYVRKMLKDKK
jgi:hypothetical protein